ncbi:MAG: RHS repeat protein [Bacteroidetes bacterium]|nr:RHS repeat protein [Bacteroidota bacterium]
MLDKLSFNEISMNTSNFLLVLRKRGLYFLLALFMFCQKIHAQNNTSSNNLSFPSTNNSFLGKIVSGVNIGVDKYSGTAQVHIPICELASKELSIPVSLDYVDGRGVRTQEYASQVGLGWKINAGGSISRVVRGFPDEQPNGYLGTGQWGQKVYTGYTTSGYTNFFTTLYNISPSYDYMFSGLNEPNGEPTVDGEPDLFNISTPFFNFQFVFDQNGNPVFSNYTGYKIIPTNIYNSSNYTSSSFQIIDDKGNQFYFGNTINSTESSIDSIYGQLPSQPFITTWYLTKIISYNGKDIINFSYLADPNNDVNYNYSWMETQNYITNPATNKIYLSTGKNTITNPKFIQTISSTLGELDFNYSYTRLDDPSVPYLSSILLKAFNPQTLTNSTSLQTYSFNYNYFNSGSTNPNLLRLQLTGLSVTGNTGATSNPLSIATFGYNTSASLPDRTLPVFDYFGYSTTMPSPIPADIFNINRAPNVTMAQAGILNSISTLQGDTWSLSYELNTYGPNGSTTAPGLRVNKISRTLPTGENIFNTYQYADANGNSYGKIYSSNYNNLQVTTTTGTQFIVYFSSSPYTVSDYNGVFVGYSTVKETNQNGGYTISDFKNYSDFQDIFNPSPNGNALSFLDVPTSSFAYKRGLMTDNKVYNVNGNIISMDQYSYSPQTTLANSGYALRVVILPSGVGPWYTYGFYSTPIDNYRLVQTIHTDYDQNNVSNSVQSTTSYTYHVNTTPTPLCLVSNISTTDSKGQSSSKTIYYPDEGISIIPMSSAEQTAISAIANANLISLPIHETDIRNAVKTDVHNSYAIGSASNNNGFYNTYLASTTLYNTLSSTSTQSKQQSFIFDQSNSNLLSSWSYSGPASSTTAGKSSAILYGYNSTYPIAKIENATSSSTYSSQQTTGTATISPAAMPGSVSFTVGYTGTLTINLNFAGSHGSSDLTFVSCTLTGPLGSSPTLCFSSTGSGCSSYGGTATILNATPGNYTLSATISSNTNPSNMPYVSCSYPLTNSNTTYSNEFFFEGFEQIGNVSTTAHTGNLSYNGSYNVPFILPNSRTYLIQWWSYSGSGWVFNEQAYTGPIILSGQIDDVRVFPTDALMTSYTYNPLVGKTSETDPSGRSIIYQYDGLNRLQTVRDQDNNILKQYDYEYQLLGAPAFNDPESGPFTRNNCGTGYIGSTVTYTVPANRYSSYVSKLAANQLAINDVNANGQNYANTNGTCTLLTNATISITNAAGTTGYSVTFTNTSTQANYNTALTATGGSLTVPFGTYNIKVTTTLTTGILVNWCTVATGHTATGSSVTLLGKTVSATGCQSLTVNSYQ